jgi:hypothetical protein
MKTPTDEIVKALREPQWGWSGDAEAVSAELAAQAADRLEELEGRALPELPEGFTIFKITQIIDQTFFAAIGVAFYVPNNLYFGTGPTPRAAIQAALDKMKETQ